MNIVYDHDGQCIKKKAIHYWTAFQKNFFKINTCSAQACKDHLRELLCNLLDQMIKL